MNPVWVIKEMLDRDPDDPEAFRTWWESRSFWDHWTEEDWHAALKESGQVYRELIAQIEAAWGPPAHRAPSGDEIGDTDMDSVVDDLELWPPGCATWWVRGEKRVCIWEEKQDVELPFTINIAVVWHE